MGVLVVLHCWSLWLGFCGVRGAKGEKFWHWPLFFPRVGFGHLQCAPGLEVSAALPFPPGQISLCSPGTPQYVVISTHCLSSSFSLLTLDFNTKMCCKSAVTLRNWPVTCVSSLKTSLSSMSKNLSGLSEIMVIYEQPDLKSQDLDWLKQGRKGKELN